MFALGLRYRWNLLAVSDRRAGLRDMLAVWGTVLGCILGNALSTNDATQVYVMVLDQKHLVASAPTTIFLFTFVGWIAGLVAGRLVARFGAGGTAEVRVRSEPVTKSS